MNMTKNLNDLIKLRGYNIKNEGKKDDIIIPIIKKSSIEVSENQVKIFEKSKAIINNFRENKKVINQNDFKEISNLRLQNYKIKFKDEYIHIIDINNGYKYATISLGNKKLKKDNPNKVFIIWNIIQILTCPNATPDCKKFCYANKFPYMLKLGNSNSVKSRMLNTIFSMIDNFDEVMLEVIHFVENTLVYNDKDVVFRWHESGDIYNHIYWKKIKRIIEANRNIKHLIYTKSIFMIKEMINNEYTSNGTIRYSLDNSTKDFIYNKVVSSGILTSRIINGKEVDIVPRSHTCNSTCDKCNKCLNKKLIDIFMPIH